jgi:extracellular factor (EF) 3-hydroxypalmitic acid methyl ester biosynthesis protein
MSCGSIFHFVAPKLDIPMSTTPSINQLSNQYLSHGSHVTYQRYNLDNGTRWRRDEADKRFSEIQLPNSITLYDQLLKQIHDCVEDPKQCHQALDELFLVLREVRSRINSKEWTQWILDARKHPILQLIHEDPFTRRAYEKPRGYAGDAVMIDYIYGSEEYWPVPQASELGRQIFEYTTNSPAPEGVRARRAYVAKEIDKCADAIHRPHVLSLAAGNFREALLSSAVKRRKLGRIVALDSDAESLSEVGRCYGHLGIESKHTSVRQLFGNKHQLGKYDLVYSTGLFDYLNQKSSCRLAANMFNMLNPGGKIIIANFLPDIPDVGYMEVFMGWNLIYRTRQGMMDITEEIPQGEIHDIRVFAEDSQNIIFLEVTRNFQSITRSNTKKPKHHTNGTLPLGGSVNKHTSN